MLAYENTKYIEMNIMIYFRIKLTLDGVEGMMLADACCPRTVLLPEWIDSELPDF
jgi:hypothetical protein